MDYLFNKSYVILNFVVQMMLAFEITVATLKESHFYHVDDFYRVLTNE